MSATTYYQLDQPDPSPSEDDRSLAERADDRIWSICRAYADFRPDIEKLGRVRGIYLDELHDQHLEEIGQAFKDAATALNDVLNRAAFHA